MRLWSPDWLAGGGIAAAMTKAFREMRSYPHFACLLAVARSAIAELHDGGRDDPTSANLSFGAGIGCRPVGSMESHVALNVCAPPDLRSSHLDSYQRRLLVFLSVATFFEGYDFIALSQVLLSLRHAMALGRGAAGTIVSIVNAGTILAYFLVGLADRWGRRRVMTMTILGYTLFTFLSGLACNVYLFVFAQFFARVFVIGELAISNIIAAEEFPAARRGMMIGIIGGFSTLGAIVCAMVTPALVGSSWGWRAVYLVGILPLAILAFARRGLRETRRFAARSDHDGDRSSFLRVLSPPNRGRLLQMAAVWFCAFVASQNTVAFWKDFAVTERGLSEAAVGRAVGLAAMVSAPLVFLFGRLMDRLGRKPAAAIVFSLSAIGTVGAYNAHDTWAHTGALILALFASAAILPLLNALTAELFPTSVRSTAFAWSHNLLGRLGYVLSPLVVGAFADRTGWGPAVSATAVFAIIVVALVYRFLPETRGLDLEESCVGICVSRKEESREQKPCKG